MFLSSGSNIMTNFTNVARLTASVSNFIKQKSLIFSEIGSSYEKQLLSLNKTVKLIL